MPIRLNILVLLIFILAPLSGKTKKVIFKISTDHVTQTYRIGERPCYTIFVTDATGTPLSGKISYQLSPESMPPIIIGTVDLNNGLCRIRGLTLLTSGFVTLNVAYEQGDYRGNERWNVGFEPENINPTVVEPPDFDTWWLSLIAESDTIPLSPSLDLLLDRCTDSLSVYHWSIRNYRNGARVFGVLTIPKFGDGTYPVLLKLPGSGIRPYYGDTIMAKRGVITLEIGIHGIPVNLPSGIYSALASGALHNYRIINTDDRESYYYNRVYIGCKRAIDYLMTLAEFDGINVWVYGHSQGGALTMVTAALHTNITKIVVHFPALCDLTGYIYGRAGGWPHIFSDENKSFRTKERIKSLSYYDVVNFAKRINCAGMYCFGYNDWVCPPTSFFSAYNSVRAEKKLTLNPETGHAIYSQIWEKANKWLLEE